MKNLTILNALRGLAAFGVLLFHFSEKRYGSPHWFEAICYWGRLGVHVFFIISGFVIPLQLQRKRYTLKKFGNFQLNRFIRIYPTFLLCAFLAAVIWKIQWILVGGIPPDLSLGNILKNLTLTMKMFGGSMYIGVLWTLTIEFLYYFFIALAFPLLFHRNRLIQIAAFSLFLASQYLPGDEMWNFFRWSPYFVIGMTLLNIKEKTHIFQNIVFLLAALILTSITPLQIGGSSGIPQTIAALIAICAVFWSPQSVPKAFMFLGTISYSFYLIHDLVGSKILKLMVKHTAHSTCFYFATFLAAIAISLFCAAVIYRFIEKPSHEKSKKAWAKSPLTVNSARDGR